jgi:hypothetical protein
VNLIWIKRDHFFAQNAAARGAVETREAGNAAARSDVETMRPCIAGGPRRQLLYQGKSLLSDG